MYDTEPKSSFNGFCERNAELIDAIDATLLAELHTRYTDEQENYGQDIATFGGFEIENS